MEESTKYFDLQTTFGPATTFRHRVNPHTGGSDHHEFVDSTIGIPCVMLLQWPDLYYHTSQDTLDKVSAPMLKRIGWIATVAALTLANADSEEAHAIAIQTYTRGASRLQTALREAIQILLESSNNPKSKIEPSKLAPLLAETADQCRSKIEHIAWRETQTVKSTKELASGPELGALIAQLASNMTDHARFALAQIQRTMVTIQKALGVRIPRKARLTIAEKQASEIVPERQFKGTLGRETLSRKALSPKDYEWYAKITQEDKQFSLKLAEILNFTDGKRNLRQIINAVTAEYTPTDTKRVLKILRQLEKQKLVILKIS